MWLLVQMLYWGLHQGQEPPMPRSQGEGGSGGDGAVRKRVPCTAQQPWQCSDCEDP